ncbi:MAG: CinA family protein [Sulfuricella sp.]
MIDEALEKLADEVGRALLRQDMMLATAESCTGGWVGAAVTAIPGSSRWYDRGFVTYSNESKQEMLGVAAGTLAGFGAVSEQTVREMVAGALKNSRAQAALAVSGIAGPGGGMAEKPVGTVCFAWGFAGGAFFSEQRLFLGNRHEVRRQSVSHALHGLLGHLKGGVK